MGVVDELVLHALPVLLPLILTVSVAVCELEVVVVVLRDTVAEAVCDAETEQLLVLDAVHEADSVVRDTPVLDEVPVTLLVDVALDEGAAVGETEDALENVVEVVDEIVPRALPVLLALTLAVCVTDCELGDVAVVLRDTVAEAVCDAENEQLLALDAVPVDDGEDNDADGRVAANDVVHVGVCSTNDTGDALDVAEAVCALVALLGDVDV